MSTSNLDQEKSRRERKLKIQRQISFASGLFHGDITIRTLLESLAEGVVIIDNTGTILLVNTAAEKMFGYPKEELIGKSHAVLVPERFRKGHEGHEAGYFKDPRIRPMGQLLDLAAHRRDGSEFPVEISLGFVETINGVLVLALVSDMTLRKEYESRFHEREELFRIQVECVKDYAIFMLDAEGNVLNWNAGAERLKGYRGEEIIGRHFSCFFPEDDRDVGKPAAELEKAAAEERAEFEGWRLRKDGSRFWAEDVVTALRDENGSLRGFSRVTHDVTERRRVLEALQFSEARYRALYRDNPTMIVTLDTELKMLSVNPLCSFLLGYTAAELEGRSVLEIFHEDDRPALAEHLRQCLESPNQVYRWQFRKIRKDGTLLWVEETAQAVYDLNGALNLLVVCQDITERKRAEEALLESEQRFASFMLHLPAAAWMKDLHGRYVYVNAEAERIFSAPLSALLDKTDAELFPPETARQFRENDDLVLADGGSLQTTEVLSQANGIEHHSIVSKFAVPGPDGQPEYVAGVALDITERKRMEEEIERLNTDLAARAFGLEVANRELEAFNYTVAHDLRKPLTLVNGYCQALGELCGDKLDEACREYLQEAYNGTLRMNRLIDSLLNFSQLAHVELHRESVNLSSLAHEVTAELQLSEPERRVTFLIVEGAVVNGDANLLLVVLDNLLGNAWKYTGMREEAVIEFGVTESDGRPAWFVRDNGAGFAMADAEKLFVPFQRLPGAEEFKGFGIGLATVARIIERHGGRLWAEGEPDKGATFFFTL